MPENAKPNNERPADLAVQDSVGGMARRLLNPAHLRDLAGRSVRTLREQGAEQLLGKGDMLYMPAGLRPIRIHGAFASDAEIEGVVEFIKSQKAPEYVEGVTAGELNEKDSGAVFDKGDFGGGGEEDLYAQAVAIVQQDKKASTSYIQRLSLIHI